MITKIEKVLLERPFRIEDLSWKPGPGSATKKIAFAHADSRAYDDRLNQVFGNDWNVEFEVIPTNDRIVCVSKLTIKGIVRSATGESLFAMGQGTNDNATTSAEAQSYKRSAVRFGLGQYLYDLKNLWGEYDAQKRRFTDAAVDGFIKTLTKSDNQRFWDWIEYNKPDKLFEVAEAIVDGAPYSDIVKNYKT